MRKPVQLVLKPEGPGAPLEVLFALCADGTIWSLARPLAPARSDREWQRLPDVPGDGDEAER